MALRGRKQEDRVVVKGCKNYEYKVDNQTVMVELKGIQQTKVKDKIEVLDEYLLKSTLENIVGQCNASRTKYIDMPKKIVLHYDEELMVESTKREEETLQEQNAKLFEIHNSKVNLDEVYLDEECRRTINNALILIKEHNKIYNEWGLKSTFTEERGVILNFYGGPGTGKSHTAKAIANELGKSSMLVNYAELESKYVGETPKNIKKVFEFAKENDLVIIFDEADSFLGKRIENVSASSDYGVNITRSVMLLELDNFKGVTIFTTNLLKNYDSAFKRRILANIEFKSPEIDGRTFLWEHFLPEKLPLDNVTPKLLGERFDNITGADIKDIILTATMNAVREQRNQLQFIDFEKGYETVTSRYAEEKVIPEPKVVSFERISQEEYEQQQYKDKERA